MVKAASKRRRPFKGRQSIRLGPRDPRQIVHSAGGSPSPLRRNTGRRRGSHGLSKKSAPPIPDLLPNEDRGSFQLLKRSAVCTESSITPIVDDATGVAALDGVDIVHLDN